MWRQEEGRPQAYVLEVRGREIVTLYWTESKNLWTAIGMADGILEDVQMLFGGRMCDAEKVKTVTVRKILEHIQDKVDQGETLISEIESEEFLCS